MTVNWLGDLSSNLRRGVLVSLWTRSCALRVSCDARHYRWQRFKPFGLISARLRVYIYFPSGIGSNPVACGRGFIRFL